MNHFIETPIFDTMFQRFKTWYNSLRTQHQLILSFGLNWVYWFVVGLVAERYLLDEQRPLRYHLFYATFMAFLMNIHFNWQKVKALFRKEPQQKKG